MGRGGWNRIAVVLFVIFVTSCGGTGGDPSNSGKQFVFTARGSLNLSVQVVKNDPTTLNLIATLLDPQGTPFGGTTVSFFAEFSDATFIPGNKNTGTAITDDSGQANIQLVAGLTPCRMRVIVEALADLNIATGLTVTLTP